MNVNQLLETGANVQLVVNALDLKELFLEWQSEALSSAAKLQAEKEEETYLSAREAAEMCDTTLTTLWRWDKTGYLKKVKMGNKVFYRKSDIKKLMEG